MTTFRVSTTVHKCYDEFYECNNCHKMYNDYNDLHFYSEDSGGFCGDCGCENIKHFVKHTVAQEVWASDKMEAVELALELDNWTVHESYYEEKKDA